MSALDVKLGAVFEEVYDGEHVEHVEIDHLIDVKSDIAAMGILIGAPAGMQVEHIVAALRHMANSYESRAAGKPTSILRLLHAGFLH